MSSILSFDSYRQQDHANFHLNVHQLSKLSILLALDFSTTYNKEDVVLVHHGHFAMVKVVQVASPLRAANGFKAMKFALVPSLF